MRRMMSFIQLIGFIALWLFNIAAVFILAFGPLITRTTNSFQSLIQSILSISLAMGVIVPPLLYVRILYQGKKMPSILSFFSNWGFLNKMVEKVVASSWVWLTPVIFMILSISLTAIFYSQMRGSDNQPHSLERSE